MHLRDVASPLQIRDAVLETDPPPLCSRSGFLTRGESLSARRSGPGPPNSGDAKLLALNQKARLQVASFEPRVAARNSRVGARGAQPHTAGCLAGSARLALDSTRGGRLCAAEFGPIARSSGLGCSQRELGAIGLPTLVSRNPGTRLASPARTPLLEGHRGPFVCRGA